MPEIKRVSIKHEAIMNFLMESPATPLGDVAAHFGVSQAWLSIIIHSPAFQDKLLEKQGTLFHHTVVATVKDKVAVLAHRTLDKLLDNVDFMSQKEAKETADMTLQAMGYGGGGKNGGGNSGPTEYNLQQIFVGRDVYEAAQGRIGLARLAVPERGETIEGQLDTAPALPSPPLQVTSGEGRLPLPGQLHGADGE